jgi:hypothetical protein
VPNTATEESLSRRTAEALKRESSAYWIATGDARARIDAEDASGRARDILDLVSETIGATSREGCRDVRLTTATSILGGFGDGYAIHTIDWPTGVPNGSLPDRCSTEAGIRQAGLVEWWTEHESGSTNRTKEPPPPDEQFEELAELGLAADLETLRANEQHDWDGFIEASSEAAERLSGWITAYELLCDRASRSDAGTYLRTRTQSGRDIVIDELAYARRALLFRQRSGAEAEAISATLLTLFLARSAFLATTAVDQDDWRTLNTVTPQFVADYLDAFGLSEWLAQLAPSAQR